MTTSERILHLLEQQLLATPPAGFTRDEVRGVLQRQRATFLALLAPLDERTAPEAAGSAEPTSPAPPSPPVPYFRIEARGKTALAEKVATALQEAAVRYREAGLSLHAKGKEQITVVIGGLAQKGRGKEDKSIYNPSDNTLHIGLTHAARIDSDRKHAVYHELAHWYHFRLVGDIAPIIDQFRKVSREKPTGGSVSDRAAAEMNELMKRWARPGLEGQALERLRTLKAQYEDATAGRIDDRRYQDLRSEWIPTEYARKNHHEWFAELVTAHVLFPTVLSAKVRAWLLAAARPNEDVGDLLPSEVFHVKPADCREGLCRLNAVAGGYERVYGYLAVRATPDARFSVGSADLILLTTTDLDFQAEGRDAEQAVQAMEALLQTLGGVQVPVVQTDGIAAIEQLSRRTGLRLEQLLSGALSTPPLPALRELTGWQVQQVMSYGNDLLADGGQRGAPIPYASLWQVPPQRMRDLPLLRRRLRHAVDKRAGVLTPAMLAADAAALDHVAKITALAPGAPVQVTGAVERGTFLHIEGEMVAVRLLSQRGRRYFLFPFEHVKAA